MKKSRSFAAIEIIIVTGIVVLLSLTVYAFVAYDGSGRRELKPHELIAAAIFFAGLFIANGLSGIASALKDRARSYNETPESKAIKELAAAVDRLARR